MDEVVRVELGASIVEARLTVAEAREAGFTVELLTNEDPGLGGLMAVGSCAVLAKRSEARDLGALSAQYGYWTIGCSMLRAVGDWLVIDSRWAEGFDARKGASVAARLLDYEAAGPADDWWITTWPDVRRGMVSRQLRGPITKHVDQAKGKSWILGNETTRVSGTVSLHRNRSSLTFEMKRREDGTFDQQLALELISECLAGGCDSAYSVAGLIEHTAPLTYIEASLCQPLVRRVFGARGVRPLA